MNDRPESGFTLNVTAEFEDVDSYGIVHHTKLVAYLERARVRYLGRLGIDLDTIEAVPVLYDLKLHFRKPARFQDSLEVSVRPVAFDRFRLTLRCRIRRGGETLVRAGSTVVFLDRERHCAVEAPQVLQDAFEPYRAERGEA